MPTQDTLDLVSQVHQMHHHLEEEIYYPAHPPRSETPQYKLIHDELVHKRMLPCLVCGVTAQTLGDQKKNTYRARAMETHHHVVEWSLAKALDLAKFNERIVQHMRVRPHHDPVYDKDFTQEQMEAWVDHHPDNLWVLCDVHHRHKYLGIHAITGPIWGPQDLLKPGFGPIEPQTAVGRGPQRAQAE
jgi:hypothetical protein